MSSLPGDLIMAQFILKITLGNDAMLTGTDICRALHDVSAKIVGLHYENIGTGKILDLNGNVVGSWQVK